MGTRIGRKQEYARHDVGGDGEGCGVRTETSWVIRYKLEAWATRNEVRTELLQLGCTLKQDQESDDIDLNLITKMFTRYPYVSLP